MLKAFLGDENVKAMKQIIESILTNPQARSAENVEAALLSSAEFTPWHE